MHLRKRKLVCFALAGALLLSGIGAPAYAAGSNSGGSIFILGNTYDEVKQMQQKLRELGYLKASATGYFGTETQEAIMAFQKDKGLSADGKAGPATQKALMGTVFPSKKGIAQPTATPQATKNNAASNSTAQSNAETSGGSIFIFGNNYEEVKLMQQKLKELGYFKGNVNGYFGRDTEQAMRDFQKAKGLSADGKAGPATQKALMGTVYPSKRATQQNTTQQSTPQPSVVSGQKGISTKGSVFVLGNSFAEVKEIQQKLKALGYLKANATGYYGTDTESAVRAFQQAKSLPVDGKTGTATQMALLGKTLVANNPIAHNNSTVNVPGATGNGKGDKVALPSGAAAKGQQTVELARKHMGKPYILGGNGPSVFDCSGLVKFVLNQQGISSHRTSYEMSRDKRWPEVSFANLRAGDLMFFDTRTDKSYPIGHVGIYIGGGMMIHASSGSGRIITAGVTSGYFKERFRVARRVFN